VGQNEARTRDGRAVTSDADIVAQALLSAADRLGVSGQVLAKVVGLSPPTVSRIRSRQFSLTRDPKAFELAVLFVRMYRSLDAIVGGDRSVAAAWLGNHNTALDARPIDLIQTVSGLTHVISYLDSRRAPL
jgi:hypothetical protein